MWVWAALGSVAALLALLAWLLATEIPRAVKLLREVRKQQHTRRIVVEDEVDALAASDAAADDASAAADDAEPVFDVSVVTLHVHWREAAPSTTADKQPPLQRQQASAEQMTLMSSVGASGGGAGGQDETPLFLLIPGNPGLVRFYRLFLLYLHRLTKGKVEVSVCGLRLSAIGSVEC
jgi:hypothetical protein